MIGKNKSKNNSSNSNSLAINLIILVGVILFVFSGYFWITKIRNNPEYIFNSMLNNNLRTASVTRTVLQDGGAQKLEQVMRIQNRTQHVTKGVTTITQGGGSTTVVTESIGFPEVEYIRYVKIDTDQKGAKGKKLEFGEVLNIWGENKPQEEGELSELYQDVTIGNLFMFADLDKASRQQLLTSTETNGVYDVDYKDVKRTTKDGRPKISYRVKLNPKQYILMVQEYGRIVGLSQFESLNPEDYNDASPISFTVTIDVISQRLDNTLSSDGSNAQSFSGYGIIENIEIPKETIPATELQKRLTEKASA